MMLCTVNAADQVAYAYVWLFYTTGDLHCVLMLPATPPGLKQRRAMPRISTGDIALMMVGRCQ